MRNGDPSTQTITITETRQHLSELVNRVFRRETRVIVEKSGIPVAAIISADDLERLIRLDQERDERFRILDEVRTRNRDLNPREIERDVMEEVEAVRRERRRDAHSPR